VTRVCDYENSHYRYDFWEGQGRQYEHLVEHIALRALLPPSGDTLMDVGAGYGRLASLYSNYRRVVLLDYARSQLEEARRFLPDLERYTFVVADVYNLPFVDSSFDTVIMVRVMHHLADAPRALAELYRVVRPQGVMVLEHANKRHWKSVARWLLRRQTWNPFDPDPVEFVDLNFDFHPAWVRRQLVATGFAIEATRAVSFFRIAAVKRLMPAQWLAFLDRIVQPTGKWAQFTPSVFVRARAQKVPGAPPKGFFCCPACRSPELITAEMTLDCAQCGRRWSVADGIYDFRNIQ
jgi:ubiquinone/menaquinone biosynthesis C-methylase UbiE